MTEELCRSKFEEWFRPLEIKYQEQGFGVVSISGFERNHWDIWQAAWNTRAEMEKSDD